MKVLHALQSSQRMNTPQRFSPRCWSCRLSSCTSTVPTVDHPFYHRPGVEESLTDCQRLRSTRFPRRLYPEFRQPQRESQKSRKHINRPLLQRNLDGSVVNGLNDVVGGSAVFLRAE